MRPTTLPLVLVLGATVSAQNIIPSAVAVVDANSQSLPPFLYVDGTRTQMVYRDDQVCNTSAMLQGIAFRRDMQDNRAFPATTVSPCDLYVGHCPNAPGSLSTTFAANITGATTQVLNAQAINLPAQASAQVFAPFNVVIPFSAPFQYLRSNGHLLLDYQVPARATRKLIYPLDGAYVGTDGQTIGVGDVMQMSQGEFLNFYATANTCVPGGQLVLNSTGLRQNYPALLLIGFASDLYQGLWLPFDMTVLGAPGNWLYTSVEAVLPFPLTQSGSTWRGAATLPVPAVQFLAGKNLFAQAVFADTVNQLGVVMSPMAAITIGGMATRPLVDSIVSSDGAAVTGGSLVRGGVVGPVIRLDGTFN